MIVEAIFEELIQGMLENEAGVHAAFIDPALVQALRSRLEENFRQGAMKQAGIGRQAGLQHKPEIRGDYIFWIDKEHNEEEAAFLAIIEDFVAYLNRTCYTGINAWEFHYALYPAGSFYRRHKDQFRSDLGRLYSFIVYLNEDWQPDDGGELALYCDKGTRRVLPEGGSAVFFRSDQTEHEVLPAHRPRMSITGWLKRV